jgi:hypothetical protein
MEKASSAAALACARTTACARRPSWWSRSNGPSCHPGACSAVARRRSGIARSASPARPSRARCSRPPPWRCSPAPRSRRPGRRYLRYWRTLQLRCRRGLEVGEMTVRTMASGGELHLRLLQVGAGGRESRDAARVVEMHVRDDRVADLRRVEPGIHDDGAMGTTDHPDIEVERWRGLGSLSAFEARKVRPSSPIRSEPTHRRSADTGPAAVRRARPRS